MKKSLIALAILGLAGVAHAQSSVTLYGTADVVLHKDKDQATKLTSGGFGSSLLGLKGQEDLGGGLNAVFKLEGALDADTGTPDGLKFNRESYVGFAGGFGEIKFGKSWTAYDDILYSPNPLFDSLFSPIGLWTAFSLYNSNPNNGIKYSSPTFGGVSGALSASLREGGSTRTSSFHVKYEAGPAFAGLGYQVDKNGPVETKFTLIKGSYDLGVAKIMAGYGRVAVDGNGDTDEMSLGADFPLGDALTFSAGVASSEADGGETARSASMGISYILSKRTMLYGGVRKDNEAATAIGGVDTRYGIAIRHTF